MSDDFDDFFSKIENSNPDDLILCKYISKKSSNAPKTKNFYFTFLMDVKVTKMRKSELPFDEKELVFAGHDPSDEKTECWWDKELYLEKFSKTDLDDLIRLYPKMNRKNQNE